MSPQPKASIKPASDKPQSWLNRILSLIGLEPDPEREKKNLLKDLKNALKHSKGRFFKVGPDQVDVGLAKFFHETYAVVGPAQSLLQNARDSQALKAIFIEQVLTENQRSLQAQLSEDNIRALAKTMPFDDLTRMIRDMLTDFVAALEIETQKRIDVQYNLLLVFLDYINFNYYFLLKKFDSMLPERDFNYLPRFESISGEYIIEDLKDFLVASAYVTPAADWDALFDVLAAYKGIEVIARANWKKAVTTLNSLKKSGILVQVTQYVSKDPYYTVKAAYPNERIVEPFQTHIRNQVESLLNKIAQERRNDKLNNLVMQVFGTTGISRTKNYTEKANLAFQKKRIAGYSLVEPMNYLKAFLLDFYKRDIREIVNLLLVKGQWMTNALAQPMSESFHALMEVSDKVTAFDDSLAEDVERGQKLKVLITRSDKDQNALSSLRQQLKDINSTARSLIIEASNHLIIIGKHLKMAIEDHAKAKHEIVLNWKALEMSTDRKLHDWMTDNYKLIYGFVQLMQFFIKDNPA